MIRCSFTFMVAKSGIIFLFCFSLLYCSLLRVILQLISTSIDNSMCPDFSFTLVSKMYMTDTNYGQNKTHNTNDVMNEYYPLSLQLESITSLQEEMIYAKLAENLLVDSLI